MRNKINRTTEIKLHEGGVFRGHCEVLVCLYKELRIGEEIVTGTFTRSLGRRSWRRPGLNGELQQEGHMAGLLSIGLQLIGENEVKDKEKWGVDLLFFIARTPIEEEGPG